MVGIQNAGPRHPVLHTELDLGRQPADVRGRENDEHFVQAADRLISRQHERGTSGPFRMLSPADLAAPHQGSCPAACSSLASRRIVSALLTSYSFERSPQPSTAPSLSAARRARPACSSLQWGARCRSFSFAVTAVKRTLRGARPGAPAPDVVRQPGPLHAFYERLRVRRGHQIAVVASARKLACLFWCLLTREEQYAHQQPSLTAKKLRRLELTAGAHRYDSKAAGVWSTSQAMRDAERKLAEQTEASYVRMVSDWQATAPRRVGASVTPGRA